VKSRIRNLIKRVPLLGKPYAQRDELRAIVQKLWESPGHFYSPIPDQSEVRKHADRIFDGSSRHVPDVELNEEAQLRLFLELAAYYAEHPFAAQRQDGSRFAFENPAFSYFDAIALYCMIRHVRPQRVIEVGSGHSSCALLDTNERFFDGAIDCTFIEPYPQLLMSLVKEEDRPRLRVLARNLQDVEPEVFSELSENDILFIDSSHVAKTGSDVNYIFFEVLPRLRRGVYVHFHDIFFPFEYPKEWVYQGRAWNEAYVLRAFLQSNSHFRIELFNSFLERFHRETIAREMPSCLQYSTHSMIPTSAQSIWLKKTAG
jgi:hypothetical protein